MLNGKDKVTSPKMASKAGKVLHDPDSSPEEKSLAGSVLAQAEPEPAEDEDDGGCA